MNNTRLANLAGLFQFSVSVASGLAQLAIVARYLPPEQAAIWALSLTLAYYLLAFDFGLGPTVTRELSFRLLGETRTGSAHNLAQASELFATAARVSSILCFCALAIGWIGGATLLSAATTAPLTVQQHLEWLLFVIGNVLTLKAGNFFSALDANKNIALTRLIKASVQLGTLLLLYIAVQQSGGSFGISLAFLFQGGLMLVGAYTAFRLKIGRLLSGRYSSVVARRLLPPSLQWTLTSLGGLLLFQSSAILLAVHGMNLEIIKFDTVVRVGIAIQAFALIPCALASPIISSWFAAADFDKLRKLVLENTRYSLGAAIVLTSVFANFSSEIISAWIGHQYLPRPTLVVLLMIVFCLEIHHVSLGLLTMSTGYLKFYRPALLAGLLNVTFGSIIVGDFGVVGLATTLLLSQLITNNWYVPYVALRRLRITSAQYLRAVLAPNIWIFICTQVSLTIANLALAGANPAAHLATAVALSVVGLIAVGTRIFWQGLKARELDSPK